MEVVEKVELKVPKLRFREFEDGWNSDYIENLSSVITSGSRDWAQYYAESGELFIRMTNLSRNGIALNLASLKYVQLPPEHSEGTRTVLESGDILISITAELGKIGWVPDDLGIAYINQHTALVRINGKADSKFIAHNLARKSTNDRLNRLNDSGAKSGLNLSTIQGFTLTVPSLPEQQKIAGFLSAVDEKLQHLNRKKELLQQYKKGVMQKLFSQELRFKREDGSDYEEWEEKRLGEVLDYEQPTKYLVNSTEYDDSYPIPVLTAGKTFILGYTDEEEGVFADNLPVIIFDDFTTAYKYVDFPFKAKSSAMKMLLPREISFNIRFIYECMSQIEFPIGEHKRYWISEYQHMEIPWPSIAEQQKIADFLSSLDKKIDAVSAQIEMTQQFKKGLLQEMFV